MIPVPPVTSTGPFRVERCSLAARVRADSLMATALPVERFILIEVPGPWATGFWDAADLPAEVGTHLRDAAIDHHARLLLIRRPGRHPVGDSAQTRRWGVVTRDGVAWGTWHAPTDLLKLHVAEEISRLASGSVAPPERSLALICTHGRKDVCCAIEGRPVAAAFAADARVDAWECSHVGGDRFAANVLWLPSGLMFGGLTADVVPAVVDAAAQDRVLLNHFRGRCGDPGAAQAATHHLMLAVDDPRPGSVVIEAIEAAPGTDRVAVVARHESDRYDVVLEPYWTQAHHLTCNASKDARMRTFRLISLRQV